MAAETGLEGQGGSAESLWEWFVENQRRVTTVGATVVVIVGIGLFWRQSVSVRNQRADTAFEAAQNAFYSGNTPLAKGDLEKLVTRYGSTPGGIQARLLLAQIAFADGKYSDGMRALDDAASAGGGSRFGATIEEHMAAGYADQKKFAEAAKHYLAAADKAAFPTDKMMLQAEAARVYQLGGNTAEARKIWADLAQNPESPVVSEARVRLGEIDAKAAARN